MDRRRLGFILLLLACIGAPAWVWYQREKDRPKPPNPGLKFGDWIRELDLVNDLGHPAPRPFPRGRAGTVVFFWHARSSAVQQVHPQFEALIQKYAKRGFEFLVIDAEPLNTADDVKARRLDLKATYPVFRDDKRKTATKLGVDRAATFLVFDAEARLVYRGAFDDGLKPPKVGHVHSAVSAILAETAAPTPETPARGKPYSDPDAPPPEDEDEDE